MSDAPDHLAIARRYVLVGAFVVAAMLAGVGFWAATATISGAIVAPGTLEVAQRRQPIQHKAGGTVERIFISNGDRVAAGQLLIRLDARAARAELAYIEEQLFENQARQERLRADYTDAGRLVFSAALREVAAAEPRLAAILKEQRLLYDAAMEGVRAQTRHLAQRRNQIAVQVLGANTQIASLSTQIALVQEALEKQQSLLARGLTSSAPILDLQRELASLQGRFGQLTSARAESIERQTEVDLEIAKSTDLRRERLIAKARDLDSLIRQSRNEARRMRDEIAAAEIRAPVAGVVHGLRVESAQTILNPTEPILVLVPQGKASVVKTRVSPNDIDLVRLGQKVKLRLAALDQRVTPEITGKISRIAPDTTLDERSGTRFFEIEARLSEDALDQLPDPGLLIHGMPVEIYVLAGDRTPLAYLVKPVVDYFARAFRES